MKKKHLAATLAVAVASLLAALPSYAQESAYADLDSCVKNEQIKLTAKGAAIGALAGFGKSLFGGKNENTGKNVAIGAVVGGAAGFAKAYFTATSVCYKKNPSWIPETKLERTKSLQATKQETKYKPEEGIKTYVPKISLAGSAKAGSTLPVDTSFSVLTPDGAETKVQIERKLYLVENGQEVAIQFPGEQVIERTVEPGTHTDHVNLPIPADTPAGTTFKVEFSVRADNKVPSTSSATTVVQ